MWLVDTLKGPAFGLSKIVHMYTCDMYIFWIYMIINQKWLLDKLKGPAD